MIRPRPTWTARARPIRRQPDFSGRPTRLSAEYRFLWRSCRFGEGRPDAAETLIRQSIEDFEKEQSVTEEIGACTSLARALLAQGKVADAQDAVGRGRRLADLRDFPLYGLPLDILQARIEAAKVMSEGSGKSQLAGATRTLRPVIQLARRLGLYSIECEARLSLGEIELTTNSVAARADLAALGLELRSRGFTWLAKQAEAKVAKVQAVSATASR